MSDLAAALLVAIRTHAAQRDEQGEPYLLHVVRVVEAVSDEAKVVAALHDVLEDAKKPGICLADLVGAIHLSMAEEGALHALTRGEGESYAGYMDAMTGGEPAFALAREVKLATLRDHLSHMPTHCEQWGWPVALRQQYERAIETLEATG